MGYYRVYKTLQDYEIVEAKDISQVHNHLTFVPFRVVLCEADGTVKLPNGYQTIPDKQQKL